MQYGAAASQDELVAIGADHVRICEDADHPISERIPEFHVVVVVAVTRLLLEHDARTFPRHPLDTIRRLPVGALGLRIFAPLSINWTLPIWGAS